jgi:hypothetical protein
MSCSFYDVPCHLANLIQYFKDLFLSMYDALLSSVSAVVSAIPAPSFLQNISFTLHPYVSYFMQAFEIQTGLSIMVSAYILRFIIRRIPVIG